MRGLIGIAVAIILITSIRIPPAAAAVSPARPSDFDGDGYADLAIGVPDEDAGGRFDSGAVSVLYGSSTGLTAAGDQLWSQDSPGIPGTSENHDHFGWTITSGDFDRDGYADLAVADLAGSLTILYGTGDGLTADGAQVWTEDDLGDLSGGLLASSLALAAGDYDGDGFADLAIGAERTIVGGIPGAGVVHIMFGGSNGLSATDALQFSQDSSGVPGEAGAYENLGEALAAGDLNDDGIDDLAIGVPGDLVGSDQTFAGGVNILYGSVDGPSVTGAQLWTQDTPGIGGSPSVSDSFGGALAIGDFDRDGFGDLAVGVPYDEIGGIKAGAVNVIYGSAAGLTASGSKWWHQGSTGVPGSNEERDAFGSALAAGDFDSDGADDLAIGAFGEAVGRRTRAGAVTVLYGSSNGIGVSGARTFTQNSTGVPGTSETSDRFGAALAAGNYGRSGRDDLAIGAFREKIGGVRQAGVVDVLYGRSSGLSGLGAQSWTQDSPGVLGAIDLGDDFGRALAP